MIYKLLIFILSLTLLPACTQKNNEVKDDTLFVYSARKEHLIKPLFEKFTSQTGIQVKYVTDKAGALLQKLKAEDENSPADILMTVDAGNLWKAADSQLFEAANSRVLSKNIPPHLKDSNNLWFGLSVRSRTIIYNSEKVDASNLSTYKDLGSPKWKKRLCLRTAKKVYNQSMVAMFIEQYGIAETEEFLKSWVSNLAAPVFSSDTAIIEAIDAGQCDVGIVNSYYLGRYIKKNSASKVKVFWPNQKSSANKLGVHVNISGAGILKSSKNKKKALALLEWLSSKEAQTQYAQLNYEYPVLSGVPLDAIVSNWGEFKQNTLNMSLAGKNQGQAIKLMDRAGYK